MLNIFFYNNNNTYNFIKQNFISAAKELVLKVTSLNNLTNNY